MIKEFINLIFPKNCLGCSISLDSSEIDLCNSCLLDLPKSNLFFKNDTNLEAKFMGLSPVKHILTYLHFTKGNVVQRIMHDIKYKNNPQLGELMGFYYGLDLNNAGFSKEFDLITSVPLHQKRLKERGYNQSDFIAKGLSKGLAIPFETNLIARIIYTDTQITKSKMNRFANMDNVFQVHDAPKILGKRILLVDDTLTTSATLSSCANILWKAAAAEVSVMALASVD